MREYTLGFGKIIIHNDHLAEVIVDDGVEMDIDIVNTYHAFLRAHLQAPFSLLINKLNSYSYTFEAQREIMSVPEIVRVAVVAYRESTRASTESLLSISNKLSFDVKIFAEFEEALSWVGIEDTLVS